MTAWHRVARFTRHVKGPPTWESPVSPCTYPWFPSTEISVENFPEDSGRQSWHCHENATFLQGLLASLRAQPQSPKKRPTEKPPALQNQMFSVGDKEECNGSQKKKPVRLLSRIMVDIIKQCPLRLSEWAYIVNLFPVIKTSENWSFYWCLT